MNELTSDDAAVVARTRRAHLLGELDRAQDMIARLESQLALVTKARSDIVEQMRRLDGGS